MKIRNVFLFMSVFVLLLSISAVCAENVTLENTVFEVPTGYSVNSTSDISVSFVRDNNTNYKIFISESNFSDSQMTKNSYSVSGFNFLAEENYVSDNNITVNQQNYMKNESYFSYYSFNYNGTDYMIGYSFPVHDDFVEGEDNPVNIIINSIH